MRATAIALTIVVVCLCAPHRAASQQRGEVYVAPGMPVRVWGPLTVPLPQPARKAVPPTIKKPAAASAVPPIYSPIFPRFWHQTEPARSQARSNYYEFQQQHTSYLVTSLRAGVGGRVWALLTVLADGTVGRVRITHWVLDDAAASIDAPSPAAEAALDEEVIRVVSQMRFEPSTIASDTVTVTQRFAFQ